MIDNKEKVTLTKRDLIKLLEPYSDDSLIVFSAKLQQGTVGFYDITQNKDTVNNQDKLILKSDALNKWYQEDIRELSENSEKRSLDNCLRYQGKPKCYYTGELCDKDYVKICKDYRSNEGLYECPHCNRKGLKRLNYGSDENPEWVWECLSCGAELWSCETKDKMLERCEEIKNMVIEPTPNKTASFELGCCNVEISKN